MDNQNPDTLLQRASAVSHDFNNQLGGISSLANLIHRKTDDPNIKKYTEEIVNTCKKSGDMMREFFNLVKNNQSN